jgi:DNA-binding NarL/FixJ family response regulator
MSSEYAFQEDGPALARPSVVFADDDPVVISSLSLQLHQTFDCAGVATTAEEAIAVVTAVQPDVVILDVNMPGGGARHATCEIRRLSQDTAIVILSSDETHEDVIELLSLGAIAYLRKGITPQALASSLLLAIDSHRHGCFAPPRILTGAVAGAVLEPSTGL